MRRMACLTPLAVVLLLPAAARSEERNRFADVRALQEAVHQSIDRAEPSIASILVSRSDKYRRYEPARLKGPGQLGRFDAQAALRDKNPEGPEAKEIRRLDLSDPNNVPEAYGSGVVIDVEKDVGFILTMAHVIRKAAKIYVRLPGGRGSWADIHAKDPRSDLAVLRLIDRVPDLKALKLGDGGKLRKGDFVLSLSNSFSAGSSDGSPSASWGMVSNLRRRATGIVSDVPSTERSAKLPLYCFGTLIQTDMRMSAGCSGGALLNLQGEVVGLTSALAGIAGGDTPGGFAVPLDAGMRRIIDVLRRGEEVEYGFLGVWLRSQDKQSDGFVRIISTVPGGPANQADLHGTVFRSGLPPRGRFPDDAGDYVLAIDGTPVHSNDDLFLVVGRHLAGNRVRVEVASTPDGPRRTCWVRLAKFPTFALEPVIASKRPRARGGLRVDWTSTIPPRQPGGRIPEGVVIREVLPDSPADKARLQENMIIKSVNRQKVTTPAEFYVEMEKARGPVELTFTDPDERREQRVTINVR
jgi:serine protease Do